jgi:hypothetical protein
MKKTCNKNSAKWLMKIDSYFMIDIGIRGYEFQNEWIQINTIGYLTIKEGYAWDGCTPKICVFGRVIGTPDGRIGEDGKPITWKASLVHDALYQFIELHKIPRKEIDALFLENLRSVDFKFARLYYAAVRMFGGIFISLTH